MLKPTDGANVFKPSFKLDERSIAILASVVKQEFFDILQRLMEDEIRLMNIKLLNLNSDDAAVLEAHRMVKYASMFYSGVMGRIAELTAIDTYNQSGLGQISNPEVPLYPDEFATPEDQI
jgi:hypothetical protein